MFDAVYLRAHARAALIKNLLALLAPNTHYQRVTLHLLLALLASGIAVVPPAHTVLPQQKKLVPQQKN